MYQNLVTNYTLTFGSGGTVSNAVYLNGQALLAVVNSGTWTAAALTFEVSSGTVEPGIWHRLYAGTNVLTAYPATAGTSAYYLPVTDAPGLLWVRGVSGQTGAGTAQAAARTITILSRPVL
jgi:hypothetical protein